MKTAKLKETEAVLKKVEACKKAILDLTDFFGADGSPLATMVSVQALLASDTLIEALNDVSAELEEQIDDLGGDIL